MRPSSIDRPFDEAGVLGEQAGVLDDFEALGEGELRGVVRDARGALGGVEDDEGALQLGVVVLEGGDREGVRGEEAVAAGDVAGGDAVDFQRHDLGAGLAGQDAEDRVQRADPAQRPVAPAHGLRPGEGADGGLDGLGDDLGGGAAGTLEERRTRPRPSCRRGSRAGRASGRWSAGSLRWPARGRRRGGPCAPRAGPGSARRGLGAPAPGGGAWRRRWRGRR